MICRSLLLTLASLALAGAALASGQPEPASAQADPKPLGYGIDQKLGAQVPLDTPFRSETNQLVTLRQVCDGKPTVFVLAYYKCPHLCNKVIRGVLELLQTRTAPDGDLLFETQRIAHNLPPDGKQTPRMKWQAGQDFQVVFLSFDPGEKPMVAGHAKVNFLAELRQMDAEKGVHFLTGEKIAIEPVADAVGFRYEFNKSTKQFDHAAGIMILNPQGQVSRYFFGADFPAEKVQAALEGKPEVAGQRETLSQWICSMFSDMTGKNSANVMLILRTVGVLTVLGLIGMVVWLSLRRRPDRATSPNTASTDLPAVTLAGPGAST